MKMKNLIGVGKASIVLKEEHSNSISNLIIKVPAYSDPQWEIQGISVSIKSFVNDSIIFKEPQLQENKSRIRHYLLEPKYFGVILEKLIKVS